MTATHRRVEEGLQHHGAGRLREAEALYRQALAEDPQNIDALHFLGVVALQRGDPAQAVVLISQALSRNPANPPACNNLGLALAAQGKRREAVSAWLEALALHPEFADAAHNLRENLRVLQPDPASDAHFSQGNADKDQGRLAEAIASYQKAVALAPAFAAAHVNLGGALAQQGRHAEACLSFRKALVLEPELPGAWFNLGFCAYQLGDHASARTALARYLKAQPQDRDALMVLAAIHFLSNELDEAAGCVERVLAGDPNAAAAHSLMADVLRNQGRHREALRHYELAVAHDPHPVIAFQNLLFFMMCAPGFSAADLHARHREFARRFEQPLLSPAPPALRNGREPGRRLKLGYLSPEFRANVVGQYLQPILEHHDRAQFELHAFFTGRARDSVTERIASLVDHFHDVGALSDEALAARVRSQQIDILVDLCGHGPGGRILAFARRLAPVQVNYLDYSATTGLSSIDYRLTTEYCDPSGVAEQYYSEQLYRLKDTFWTYNPSVRLPLTDLPMKSSGAATFGSFNLYYRITSEVLDLWMRVLQAIPRSRLLIVGVPAGSTHAALLERLDRAAISRERVAIHGVVPYQKYNELMGEVDIALAPFPYNGATTVMDCLWNGLPVVAKAGAETFTTRLGCSVLASMGLSELIGADDDGYLRIAERLAADAPRLAELRRTLRERLERSPMRDFPGFTRELEYAYRAMWKRWCA
ncbi:MAG TPA: tetratricopeptide repeat protein [Burkholderiales bacterium]|nr:tetratricopeptide repeat protein [Burkholderiales bacterium]